MQKYKDALEVDTLLDAKSKTILAEMARRLSPDERDELVYEVTLARTVTYEHRESALQEVGDSSNYSKWGLLHLSDAALDWLHRWLSIYSFEKMGEPV